MRRTDLNQIMRLVGDVEHCVRREEDIIYKVDRDGTVTPTDWADRLRLAEEQTARARDRLRRVIKAYMETQ